MNYEESELIVDFTPITPQELKEHNKELIEHVMSGKN